MKPSLRLVWASLSTTLVLSACAQKPPQPLVIDQTEEVSARVQALDVPTRRVTLIGDSGDPLSMIVGPGVANFSQIQVGDRVAVRYYAGMAFEVKPPGEAAGVPTEVAALRANPGERPAGAVGQTIRTLVTIEGVDVSNNTVTFRGEDGAIRAIDVVRPESREFIKRLEPGDRVEVTYTEALAVSVEPAT